MDELLKCLNCEARYHGDPDNLKFCDECFEEMELEGCSLEEMNRLQVKLEDREA